MLINENTPASTYQNPNRQPDVIYAENAGVVGDGQTDDTDALNRLFARAVGAKIVISPTDKHYRITDELKVPSGAIIEGCGELGKIKQYTPNKNVFDLTNVSDVTLHRVCAEGYGGQVGSDFAKNNGVYGSGCTNVRVLECTFIGFEGCGIQFRNSLDLFIDKNLIYNGYWSAGSIGANSTDIAMYSSVEGGRTIISNNMCYSNNSQGIWVNALGTDKEIIINNNICVTMQNRATGQPFSEISASDPNFKRRHGIELAYNGGSQPTVMTVSGNICSLTKWSGIYENVNFDNMTTGPYTITGNQVINCCLESGVFDGVGGLAAGILMKSTGRGDIVSNNVITGCLYAPGIVCTMDLTNDVEQAAVIITSNTINTCRKGIYLGTRADNVFVTSNGIFYSTEEDISIVQTTGFVQTYHIYIENNNIIRNNTNFSSIKLDQAAVSTKSVYVQNNHLYGSDKTVNTAGNVNTGIYCRRSNNIIRYNTIENYYWGIYHELSVTNNLRVSDHTYTVDFNRFVNLTNGIRIACNTGVSGVGSATVLFEGNMFTTITTAKISSNGSFNPAYIGRRIDDKFEIFQDANPTTGSWIQGDRRLSLTTSVGGSIGGVCTVIGVPGTWVNYGTI